MSWRLFNTASGCDSLEDFYSPCGKALEIAALLEKAFDAKTEYFPVAEEELFIELIIDGFRFAVGWDSFSGCYIMSDSPKGNAVIERLADFLSGYSCSNSTGFAEGEYPPIDYSVKRQL